MTTNPLLWVGYPRSYTPGRARAPQFVTLHYTAGSEGPTSAEAGVAFDKSRTDGTSCHAFFDSLGPGLQEVPFGDRSHSAFFHGNEIGIHFEICGTIQTREQWLDDTSLSTLRTCAEAVRYVCDLYGWPKRRLTIDETRAAYYAPEGSRPCGINDHNTITQAFPEDPGTHTDVGPEFPWDVFMDMVLDGGPIVGQQVLVRFTDCPPEEGGPNQVWLCDGMFRRRVPKELANGQSVTDGGIGNNGTHTENMLGLLGNKGQVFPSSQGGWAGRDAWGMEVPWAGSGGGSGLTADQVRVVVRAELDKTHLTS